MFRSSTLLREGQREENNYINLLANAKLIADISFDEVSKAIDKAKVGKAYLEIPNEIMKNINAKSLLHKFFNLCFKFNLSPNDWNFSDIKPIGKKDKDQRDPLNNRCISIMCCVAKVYSGKQIQEYKSIQRVIKYQLRSKMDSVLVDLVQIIYLFFVKS